MRRLISALTSDSSAFFIHIDKKSNIEDFSGVESKNIIFTKKRVAVYWAEYSQVEAILELVQTALASSVQFDRFVLLSGADYPLRSSAYIEEFFRKNRDAEFLNFVAMPADKAGKPISRLNTFKFATDASAFSKLLRKVLIKVGATPRERNYKKYLANIQPYGGSTWWALSREACLQIISFIDSQSRVVRFYKNTICPDESIFQTIIGNSPLVTKVSRNLTYADWSKGGASPISISEDHLDFFKSIPSFPSSVIAPKE